MKKYREYFMFFAGGVAFATSLLGHRYFIINYVVLFIVPVVVVIAYMMWQSLRKN